MNLNEPNNYSLWFQLLNRIDRLNRNVKEPGWNFEDKDEVYRLKDTVIKKLLTEKPAGFTLYLYYVPYISYSESSKDRAGELMRRDFKKQPFDYYLSLIEPSVYDREIPEKASVEVEVITPEQTFDFHMPVNIIEECGYSITTLERKKWIPAPEFHHRRLCEEKEKIASLLEQIG